MTQPASPKTPRKRSARSANSTDSKADGPNRKPKPRKNAPKFKSESTIVVETPKIDLAPLDLYPYQKAWIDDRSRRKIATKSRRIGYSFGAGLGGVLDVMENPHNFIVLSRGERQSKEFIADAVAPHCRAIGLASQYVEGYIPGTEIKTHEVKFDHGGRIIALPANPDTARSYEGDVLLDEFGFHKNAREIYQSVTPSIARGYKLSIVSTPNGQQGSYYDLCVEAGLVEDMPAKTDRWSKHKTDVYQAVRDGFRDRFGKIIDLDELRLDCLDEDMWMQEYNCAFLATSSQWIPPQLFQQNVDPNLDCVFEIGVMPIQEFAGRELYGGWDIARNKDLSVVWIFELLGDVAITRGVIEMAKIPTPDQKREARRLMPFLHKLTIDKSGMGLSIFEDLELEFGPMVQGVSFTMATKEALAVWMKSRMEAVKARLPDTDMVRNSFRSVKKITTATGQSRFDAEHDDKYGHADHWWAAALANSGCANPTTLGLIEYYKQQQRKIDEEMKKKREPVEPQKAAVTTSDLTKPATNASTPGCPECGSASINRLFNQNRCAQCGHQWGGNPQTQASQSRKDFLK